MRSVAAANPEQSGLSLGPEREDAGLGGPFDRCMPGQAPNDPIDAVVEALD